jgi:hypothetical protein
VKHAVLRSALPAVATLVGIFGLTTMAACGRSIGDSCTTNTDCSPNGDRICDVSQPGGYCTIDGCNDQSCPSEAVCMRFFPQQFLSRPCSPACEDQGDACCQASTGDVTSCNPAVATTPACDCASQPAPATCPTACPRGRTDDCTADEVCLDVGLCAPRSTERRLCVKSCSSNGDCRGGYECRQSGTEGSMALLQDPTATAKFCAPIGPL